MWGGDKRKKVCCQPFPSNYISGRPLPSVAWPQKRNVATHGNTSELLSNVHQLIAQLTVVLLTPVDVYNHRAHQLVVLPVSSRQLRVLLFDSLVHGGQRTRHVLDERQVGGFDCVPGGDHLPYRCHSRLKFCIHGGKTMLSMGDFSWHLRHYVSQGVQLCLQVCEALLHRRPARSLRVEVNF